MNKRTKTLLALILAVSVLLRLAAAIYLGDQVENLPGTADQLSYHTLAQRVLGGHGFTFGEPWWPATAAGAPTAHWSFLYTAYLVVVYGLLGPHPLAARLIQAVLVGLLQPFLAYLIGRRVFGQTVGLVAAALTAIYAYFIYYAANLMTESFYIVAILASLYIAMQMAGFESSDSGSRSSVAEGRTSFKPDRPWIKNALVLGLALGAALLLRQLFLLFIPFLFLWILWASRGRQLRALVLSGLVIVALILPITLFNYSRFHRFVLLNTNAGYAFFWGNHPIYGDHFIPILPSEKYAELIPPELRSLDEASLDQALLRRGLQFILDDPLRYLRLSISRIPAYFMFWPSSGSGNLSNLSRVLSFGVLWPFMLYGLALSLIRSKGASLRSNAAIWLLCLFMFVYTFIHLLTWALIRYRLPVDAVLVVFAGLALVEIANRIPALRRLGDATMKMAYGQEHHSQ